MVVHAVCQGRPDARAASSAEPAERPTDRPADNIDIWKALDEGRDPTA